MIIIFSMSAKKDMTRDILILKKIFKETIMNIVKEFDLAVKQAETNATEGAYLAGGREYDAYMTNAEWEAFRNEMSPSARAEYGAGGGDELSEKNGRPPKMASYGSSSRMIHRLSKHKKEFHYEKKLSTTVGGTANLDGFYESDGRYVFVEAKCHEPYSAKKTAVSKSYRELYEFINAQMPDALRIEMMPGKCGRYLNVEFFVGNEKTEHFDLKQMICHLLGIATGMLKGELTPKQTDFIYLLYDPTDLPLSGAAKEEIEKIYAKTCDECNAVDFSSLLRVMFAFLKKQKYPDSLSDDEIDTIVGRFTFILASQEFYPILLQ